MAKRTAKNCGVVAAIAFACAVSVSPLAALATTIDEALSLAYANNPTINAQRAQVRATDENIPQAKAGLRPRVTGDARISRTWVHNQGRDSSLTPGGFGVTISQTLFDGFRTQNTVAAAQAAVYASREQLRNTVQNVLFDAASAYMDVLRDQAIASFRAQALEFLNEQVRSERARFQVGESTRTDVAQAEASQANAQAQLSAARAQLQSSIAIFRQIVGIDPKKLKNPSGVDRRIPGNLDGLLKIAFAEHPAILATKHAVDQAQWNVKTAESDLLPRVTVEGSADRDYNSQFMGQITNSASVTARLTVPIYQGGLVSAQVRQNKETLGQRWIEVDETVDNVRAAVVSAVSQLEAARGSVQANQAQLRAAELALQGAVEERKVGQRTTLDVLNTQQGVINAQIALASSRRDQIVAGYAVLSSIGRLDPDTLSLAVERHDPVEHYNAVVDKWYGLRTPDGR
jgi:outer membrane protein